MKREIWRKVQDSRDYEVSSLGRVRSLDRTVATANGHVRRYCGSIIKPSLNSKGYPRTWIRRFDGSREHALVHVLVARAFLGVPPDGMEVAHNDGNRLNAAVSNLRYDTHAGNLADMVVHGTRRSRARHERAVLTEEDVRNIRARLARRDRQNAIATDFGVCRTTISAIATGRSWRETADAPAVTRFHGRAVPEDDWISAPQRVEKAA